MELNKTIVKEIYEAGIIDFSDDIYYKQEELLNNFFKDLISKGIHYHSYEVRDTRGLEIEFHESRILFDGIQTNSEHILKNCLTENEISFLYDTQHLCSEFLLECFGQDNTFQINFILDPSQHCVEEALILFYKHFPRDSFVKENSLYFLTESTESLSLEEGMYDTIQDLLSVNIHPIEDKISLYLNQLIEDLTNKFDEIDSGISSIDYLEDYLKENPDLIISYLVNNN